jgi:hypothetical protein
MLLEQHACSWVTCHSTLVIGAEKKICYNFSFRLRLAISGHRVRTSLKIHGDDELLRPCGHPRSDLYTSASAVIQGTIAFGSLNGNDCDRIMVAIPEVGSTCQ